MSDPELHRVHGRRRSIGSPIGCGSARLCRVRGANVWIGDRIRPEQTSRSFGLLDSRRGIARSERSRPAGRTGELRNRDAHHLSHRTRGYPMSVRAMKRGAVEFLTKPFRKEELLDAVQEALRRDSEGRMQRSETSELRKRLRIPHSTRAASPGAGCYGPLKQTDRRRAWDHRGDDQSAPRPRNEQNGGRVAGRTGSDGREAQSLFLTGHSTKV
jgi:hypothetical protein